MLNADQARRIAAIILEAIQSRIDEPLVFVEPPREFRDGWIFVYDSERYLRSGEISAAIGGNGPIAVFASGKVEILDTAHSLEQHISRLDGRA
jgi:hypothetical protein